MARHSLILASLGVLTIAHLAPAPVDAQRRNLIADPRYGIVWAEYDTMSAAEPIPAPPDITYKLLLEVYKNLGIKTEVEDPENHQVGNTNFWKMRQLKGERLSTYFGCGKGITGANADSYRVYLSMVSRITAAEDGSSLIRTAILASAQDITQGAKDPVSCLSSGMLERRIRTMVLARMTGANNKFQLQSDPSGLPRPGSIIRP